MGTARLGVRITIVMLILGLAGCDGGAVDTVRLEDAAGVATGGPPASAAASAPASPLPTTDQTVMATPPPAADADGQLDCLSEEQFETTMELAPNTTGFESQETAVETFLLQRALSWQIQTITPPVGTIVLDGREVFRAIANQLPDGTHLVTNYGGCSGEPPGPDGTTSALDQACPDPAATPPPGDGRAPATDGYGPLFDVLVLAYGRQYSLRESGERPIVLAQQVGTTECRIADGAWPDARLRIGDATLLPVGTPVFAVEGESVNETVGVEGPRGPRLYQYVGLEGAAPLVTPSPSVPAPRPSPTSAPTPTSDADTLPRPDPTSPDG